MRGCRKGAERERERDRTILNKQLSVISILHWSTFHKGPRQSIRVAIYTVTFVYVLCVHIQRGCFDTMLSLCAT